MDKIGTLISSKDNISKEVYEEANKWAKEVFKAMVVSRY